MVRKYFPIVCLVLCALFLVSYEALRAAESSKAVPEAPKTVTPPSADKSNQPTDPFQSMLKHFEEMRKNLSTTDPLRSPFSIDPFDPDWEKNFENMFKQMTGPSLNFGLNLPLSAGKSLSMPAQVKEDHDKYIVTIDLPGADKKSIDLKAREKSIIISSERKSSTTEEKDQKIHRQEISYGHMSRVIELPGPILENQVTASFDNGVLTVVAPMNPNPPKEIDGHTVQIQ